MATNWPYSADAWGNKTDFVDIVFAAHVNNLQDGVMALETEIARTYRPDLKPAAPSAYDDEFETGLLDPKWTAINCATGTVDLLSVAAAKDTWDATMYTGMMALQPGRDDDGAAGPEAEAATLRQTVALAANCKIVAKLNVGSIVDVTGAGMPGFAGFLLSGANGFNDNNYIGIKMTTMFDGGSFTPYFFGDANVGGGGPGMEAFIYVQPIPIEYLMILKTGTSYTFWAGNKQGIWSPASDGAGPPDAIAVVNANALTRLSIYCHWPPAAAEVNLPNPIATFDWIRYFENNTPLVNA